MVNDMNNSSNINLVNLPEESKPIWTNIERVKKPLHGEGKNTICIPVKNISTINKKKQQHNWSVLSVPDIIGSQ